MLNNIPPVIIPKGKYIWLAPTAIIKKPQIIIICGMLFFSH